MLKQQFLPLIEQSCQGRGIRVVLKFAQESHHLNREGQTLEKEIESKRE